MKPIIQKLNNSRETLIVSHVDPDGDAIGSLIALGSAMDKMGKNTVWLNESNIPTVYSFLPSVHKIVQTVEDPRLFDTVVVLDCGDLERVGSAAEQIQQIPTVVNIDHHTTNTNFGTLHYVDTDACATAEIVYRLIKALGASFDKTIGMALYTGILTDTGSFRFSNTNQAAFAICQEMVAYGAEPHSVAKHVYGTYSLGRIKLLNLALDSLEITSNGRVSLMTLTQEMLAKTGTDPEDAEGLINYARRIQDVRIAALIRELAKGECESNGNQRFHVSLRSDGSVDVADIATTFGGGGHSSAAGFSTELSLPQLKTEIVNLADHI